MAIGTLLVRADVGAGSVVCARAFQGNADKKQTNRVESGGGCLAVVVEIALSGLRWVNRIQEPGRQDSVKTSVADP